MANSFTASLILLHALPVQNATFGVDLSKLQSFQGDLIIVGRQRPLFQKLLGLFGSFGGIASQHALIKYLRRRQRGPVAEHYIQKFQSFNMAPEYDEANRQGRG